MVSDREDYSDYITHLSNMGNMYSFLSGFMFTAITLVITILPDLNAFLPQFALFFMAVMLNAFIFYMGSSYMSVLKFCKPLPSRSGRKSVFNVLSDFSVMLGLGGSTILLFLLRSLIYLAAAQLIAWVVLSVFTYRSVFKPFYEKEY